jgi:hypothetical protein
LLMVGGSINQSINQSINHLFVIRMEIKWMILSTFCWRPNI